MGKRAPLLVLRYSEFVVEGSDLTVHAGRDMAVAVRILYQVVLVIFLCVIETGERSELYAERVVLPALLSEYFSNDISRFFVSIVNAGLVLAADIMSLLILDSGVDTDKVGFE